MRLRQQVIQCKEDYLNRNTLTSSWDKHAGQTNYDINNQIITGNR